MVIVRLFMLFFAGSAAASTLSSGDIFDPTRVHKIHIKLSAEAWDLLQPGVGATKASGVTNRTQAKGAGVRLRPNSSGYAFVLCQMEFDGRQIPDVGLRFKGNSSYSVSSTTLRRPMKIDFDRFVEDKRFAGIESLNLSNTSFDPSQVRENLAFSLFHQLDIPASRTGHALVYLTVAGKYDHEYLGLYTLIEEIDHHFLRKHFDNADGLLLKPSGMRGIAYLGESWDLYKSICSQRLPRADDSTAPTNQTSGIPSPPSEERARVRGQTVPLAAPLTVAAMRQRIIDLAKLIHKTDDATFRAKIPSLLAVDEFLRFVAINSALANYDSFLSTGHNYYLYVHPTDGLIHFIPWDVNMAFGCYSWVGTDDEIVQTSITRSYADHNILIERLLAIDEYARAYRAHMQKLVSLFFNPSAIRQRRELLRPVLAASEQAERETGRTNNPTPRSVSGLGLTTPDLWPFIDRRSESIKLQLEGKQTGFKPDFRNPKRVLDAWASLTVVAVTFMDAADTNGDRRLSDTEVQGAINRLFAAGNLPSDGSFDRTNVVSALDKLMSDDLRRRVPAKSWADWLFTIGDTNNDGRLTAQELFAAYHRYQSASDADRDGMMDGRDMLEALSAANAPRDPDPRR